VQEILALVKTQLENTGQGSSHVLPASKLAIVTSLNIASKYVKLKREYEGYKQRVEEKISQLSARIEKNI